MEQLSERCSRATYIHRYFRHSTYIHISASGEHGETVIRVYIPARTHINRVTRASIIDFIRMAMQ